MEVLKVLGILCVPTSFDLSVIPGGGDEGVTFPSSIIIINNNNSVNAL